MSLVAMLGPAQTDEAVGAFNNFRKGVMQACNSNIGCLDDIIDDLNPKFPLLDFLVSLYEQRRMYRAQITVVWTTLLRCDSWLRTAYDNRIVWSKLPDALQSVILLRARPLTPRPSVVASESEASVPTDSRVLAAVHAAEAAQASKPSKRRSIEGFTFFKETPELELQNAMLLISKWQQSKDRDAGLIAFGSYQRALSRISSLKDKSVETALEEIEPKRLAFEFLVDVYARNKMQRKRVCTVFKTLLQMQSWQHALTCDSVLCSSLPLELRLVIASAIPEAVDAILASDQREIDFKKLQKYSSVLPIDAEGQTEVSNLEGARDNMLLPREVSKVSKVTYASLPSSPLMFRVYTRSDFVGSVTFDCKDLQSSIQDMSNLSFRASPMALARNAFDKFAKGVRQTVRKLPDDYIDFLDSLEPKAPILEFFVDLHTLERNRNRCNAVRSLLFRLLDLRAWSDAMEGDEPLRDIIAEGLPGRRAPAIVVSRCICGGRLRRSN